MSEVIDISPSNLDSSYRGVFKKWSDFKWKATYKSCILKIVFFKQNKEILRTYSQLIKSETVEEGC